MFTHRCFHCCDLRQRLRNGGFNGKLALNEVRAKSRKASPEKGLRGGTPGKEVTEVRSKQVNRLSLAAVVVLSATALLTLLPAALNAVITGQVPRPEPDEGTGAHVFQLSVAALLPSTLLFLATADWARPWQNARALALPACAVMLAFGILYYFEHTAIIR